MHGPARTLLLPLALIFCCLVPGACGPASGQGPASSESCAVLDIGRGDLVYTYHLATRTESLFDHGMDPEHLRNIIRQRPEDARILRLTLEDELDVPSLDEIDDARHIEDALRGLGYI